MAERLVGKALEPEHTAQKSMASHPEVEAETGGFRAIARGIVESKGFFEIPACRSEVTQEEMGWPHHFRDQRESMWFSKAFGESQGFLGKRQHTAQFSPEH